MSTMIGILLITFELSSPIFDRILICCIQWPMLTHSTPIFSGVSSIRRLIFTRASRGSVVEVSSYVNMLNDISNCSTIIFNINQVFLISHRIHADLWDEIDSLLALINLGDVFFSLWLNDIPSQMNTLIRSQPSPARNESVPFSSTDGFQELQHNSSVMAIQVLERALRSEQHSGLSRSHVTFPRQQRRRFPTFVKSPSHTDDLIFYTNILPVDLHTVPFNISRDFERGTRRNLPTGITVRQFSVQSTSAAVDGDPLTCWRPHRDLLVDDFFAIDFLRAQSNVSFILSVDHGSVFQSHLEMSISFDGLWWILYRSTKGIFRQKFLFPRHLQTYLVDAAQFTLGFSSFRYIKYKTKIPSEHRFEVCELQLITNDKIDQIRTQFRPLNTWNSFSSHSLVIDFFCGFVSYFRCWSPPSLIDIGDVSCSSLSPWPCFSLVFHFITFVEGAVFFHQCLCILRPSADLAARISDRSDKKSHWRGW